MGFNNSRPITTTACNRCKHRIVNKTPGIDVTGKELIPDPTIWYNNTCAVSYEEPDFDCLTGEMDPPENMYCRDVNKGACSLFEESEK